MSLSRAEAPQLAEAPARGPLPAPNGDFYQVTALLSEEDQALLREGRGRT